MKAGLDYFSVDVDFFSDDKIQFISVLYGMRGECIVLRLLCKIYRNGYFLYWDADAVLLLIRNIGDDCTIEFVNQIIDELVKRNFFNKTMFDTFSILTSHGIQQRYFEATGRRKNVEVKKQYLLVDLSKYNNCTVKNELLSDAVQEIAEPIATPTIKKQDKKTNNSFNKQDEFFESLWLKYPKKRGKSQVTKKSKQEIYNIGLETMLNCVTAYNNEINENQTALQYVLNGSTFFNGRWRDYVFTTPQNLNGKTLSEELKERKDLTDDQKKAVIERRF